MLLPIGRASLSPGRPMAIPCKTVVDPTTGKKIVIISTKDLKNPLPSKPTATTSGDLFLDSKSSPLKYLSSQELDREDSDTNQDATCLWENLNQESTLTYSPQLVVNPELSEDSIHTQSSQLQSVDIAVNMESFDDVWSAESLHHQAVNKLLSSDLMPDDPMAPCNPFDAEGKALPELEVQEIQAFLQEDKPAKVEVKNDDFDLLNFVVNSELPVDDPAFNSFLEDEEVQDLPTIDKLAIQPSSSRSATGPSTSGTEREYEQKPSLLLKAPRAPRMKFKTEEEKYRRMRECNNIASRRCRKNRKIKFQQKVSELDQLEEKNKELRMKLRVMEEQVANLKKSFLNRIANPKPVHVMRFSNFVNETGDLRS